MGNTPGGLAKTTKGREAVTAPHRPPSLLPADVVAGRVSRRTKTLLGLEVSLLSKGCRRSIGMIQSDHITNLYPDHLIVVLPSLTELIITHNQAPPATYRVYAYWDLAPIFQIYLDQEIQSVRSLRSQNVN